MSQERQIPKIEVNANVLTITITADELKFVAENDPKTTYKVTDAAMFLRHFAANLEDYASSNALELGISELQMLFDKIIEETYTNDSEAIIDTEEKL